MQGEDDYLQFVISAPEELPDTSSQAGGAAGQLAENSPHGPGASPPSSLQGIPSPAEQGAVGPQAVGGLLPEVWAELFRRHRHLLEPVMPWLRRELAAIYGPSWWQVESAESTILHILCIYGPDGDGLLHVLQDCLGEHTAALVHGVIHIIGCQCVEEAQRMLRSHTAGEEDDSSVAASNSRTSSSSSSQGRTPHSSLASSTSPADSDMESNHSTSEVALHGCPTHPPPAPVPAERQH